MSYHTKIVHEKIKDNECQHCDVTFSLKENLTRHVKIVHEGIREYECKTCGHEFGTNQELQRHIKAIHEKIQSQENIQDQGDHVTETTCAMCGFTSSKISELSCHYYAHFPVPGINQGSVT